MNFLIILVQKPVWLLPRADCHTHKKFPDRVTFQTRKCITSLGFFAVEVGTALVSQVPPPHSWLRSRKIGRKLNYHDCFTYLAIHYFLLWEREASFKFLVCELCTDKLLLQKNMTAWIPPTHFSDSPNSFAYLLLANKHDKGFIK